MFKALRELIKAPTRSDEFEKCLRQAKTLFSPSADFNRNEIQKLVEAFLGCSATSSAPVRLLSAKIASANDWVIHLKTMALLVRMFRKSRCEHLPNFLVEYLSTNKTLQQHLSAKPATTQSTSSQVYNQLLMNLKSYGLKICSDKDTYRSLWHGRSSWEDTQTCLLFKIFNNCNYLLATKSVFSKLFKEFDPSEIFSELFRLVLEQLAVWLEYVASGLHNLLEHSKELEFDELQTLEQLCEQAKRLYSRTNLMARMVDIHSIPIEVPHLRPIRVPFEFKLSVEKNRTSSDSTKTGSFVRRVLQLDSLDRSFKEDELDNSRVCTRSRKHMRSRSAMHMSMVVARSFKEEL